MAAILGMAAIGVWAVTTERVGYVVTQGTSMNPVYHQNDLVVVVKAHSYQVGQIAAYHGESPGQRVLHRIIAGSGSAGFVMKGDNNQSIDPSAPTAGEMIGRAVLHVPHGGIWLKPFLGPSGLGMLGFLVVSGGATAVPTRREIPRGRRKKRVRAMSRQGGSWAAAAAALKALERLSPWLRVAAAAGATITVVALTLAVLGWMKPVVEKQAATAQPERSITFSYSATVPKSPAYDGTTVTSPDPVFRRIVDHVDLHARYHGPAGTFRLTATLTNGTGWHSAMTLVRDKAIAGPDYDVTVPLDLSSLTARADDASRAIGAPATGSVSIALNAAVSLSGPALSAPLNLTITPAQMSLGAGSMLRTTTAGGDPSGVLVPRRIRILGLSLMTASEARSDAVLCLLGVAGIAVALFLVARRRTPLRTRADIERRYAPFLVHVEPMASPPGKPVVNVDNFPALVRLAERYGQMILTWRRPDADCFVVRDEGITYRYRILLDEPATQNVELINRPTGAGSHRRRATSEAS